MVRTPTSGKKRRGRSAKDADESDDNPSPFKNARPRGRLAMEQAEREKREQEQQEEEPKEPKKKPMLIQVTCRYPGDNSQSADLREAILRYAENKFPLFSADGIGRTTMKIIAQIWNGDKREHESFHNAITNTYDNWAQKPAAKFPKKSNEGALFKEFKKWFTIYMASIKTSWFQRELPSEEVEELSDVDDMIIAMSRKTYDASLSKLIYANDKKGTFREKRKAMEAFEATYDVSATFLILVSAS
jgi:hypothetical protein